MSPENEYFYQPLKVEILYIVKENEILNDIQSFKNVIQANQEITIDNDKLKYLDTIFNVTFDYISDDSKDLLITIILETSKDNKIKKLESLLRKIKKIILEYNLGDFQLIWDDISKYYCIKAYPLIHDIENIMRQLITKFMFINVGKEWIDTAIPKELTKKPKSKYNAYNLLYETDFIQLSDFLFKTYSELELHSVINEFQKMKFEDFDINKFERIKKIFPQSNWDKYFNKKIDTDQDLLAKKWKELYDLRCKVAHNNIFSESDLRSVIELVDFLKPKLNEAIKKTSRITIDNNEKYELTAQLDGRYRGLNEDTRHFIYQVYSIRTLIKQLYDLGCTTNGHVPDSVIVKLNMLVQCGLLDEKNEIDILNLFSVVTDEQHLKLNKFEIDKLHQNSSELIDLLSNRITDVEIALEPQEYDID